MQTSHCDIATDYVSNPLFCNTAPLSNLLQETKWPSPAKLNLFLYITGQRSDGYHELQTYFQLLDYGDILDIKSLLTSDIKIATRLEDNDVSEITTIPVTDNLIYKAAKELQQVTGCKLGADICLTKIIPIGAGLGGGSSNAATTLVALNKLWQTNLSVYQLQKIGLSLGADIPFFIQGYNAFAESIGERFTHVEESKEEKWFLVVKPECSVNTKNIFTHPELTRNTPKRTIQQCMNTFFANDCQRIVCQLYPEIEKGLQWLLQYAADAQPRLTGTGSCLFAQFPNKQAALALFSILPPWLTGFVSRGINVSPLLTKLAMYPPMV